MWKNWVLLFIAQIFVFARGQEDGELMRNWINFELNIIFAQINCADSLLLIPDRDGNFEFYDESTSPIIRFGRDIEVKMILYTHQNKKKHEGQRIDNYKFNESNFDGTYPTRILTHGWFNDGHSEFNQDIKDAYLLNGFYNVIIADWSDAAVNLNYLHTKWGIYKKIIEFVKCNYSLSEVA